MARCPDLFARPWRPGLLVVLVLLAAVGPAAEEGENVLVILLDGIGVELLSVYGEGSNYPVTPTIDQLRSEGILFRNLWSAPSCTPTRATLLTGRRSA
ncbi:MAG: hypothetical protein E2P04_03645 [Acidobacteria bacterium]|nr:MAG: hypothetical protein E2P04_03645 [Acidobacteriota bacterium]